MGKSKEIDRGQIVHKALELLDDGGLDMLSMRRLADALGVKAASLYWHFPTKQDLLDVMADELLSGVAQKPSTDRAGEKRLLSVAKEIRLALTSRRDGARVYAGTFPVLENTLRVSEALLRALTQEGFTAHDAAYAVRFLSHYIIGFTIEEQAARYLGDEQRNKRKAELRSTSKKDYPSVFAAVGGLSDFTNKAFEAGLRVIIAGIRSGQKSSSGLHGRG